MKDEKVLFVTGASSDVGMALLKKIAINYSVVYAHYFSSNRRLMELDQTLPNTKIIPVQADFNSLEDTEKLAEKFKTEFLLPDDVVYLAAEPIQNIAVKKAKWELFEKQLHTGLRSIVETAQIIVPNMMKRKSGHIVIMLSHMVVCQPTSKHILPYITAKYAMLGLMKALSSECAGTGVTVNGISPAMMETKFLANMHPLTIEKNASESPMGRNLMLDEVIPTIEYLLSDASACVTGQNIAITGGA